MRLHWRIGELDPGTSVRFAPPQREVRVRHVSDPLAIGLDFRFAGRDARKVNGELLRLAIQADQIEAALLADHEKLLAIRARGGITEHKRAHGELRRTGISLAKKRAPFSKSPDVLGVVASRFKEEVFSVRRPVSAKFLGRLVPVWQHRMQTLSVGRNLPQRRSALVGVPD